MPRSAGRLAAGGSLLLGGVGTALFLAPQAGATGSTFTVTNTNDSGTGSLRQALISANADSIADTVVFDGSVSGSIHLLSRLEIKDSVVITGPGKDVLTIDASTETSGHKSAFYMYSTSATFNVSISGLRVTGANSDIDGGAFASFRTNLTLDSMQIDNNRTAGRGGAIWSWSPKDHSTVTITNSTMTDNYAKMWGGALAIKTVDSGTQDVTVSNSSILRNETLGLPSDATEPWNGGAGVELRMTGNATFTGDTIADNFILNGPNTIGVALLAVNNGDLVLSDCTISGNHADAGYTRAALFVANPGSGHVITITDSTFSNNVAPTTGALYARTDNDVTISNSTFTGNSSSTHGAGAMHIADVRSLTLNQDTISGNTAKGAKSVSDGGGGITFNSIGTFQVSGTIISGNHADVADRQDVSLYLTGSGSMSATHSILGSIDPGITVTGTGNINSSTPGLAALADNGGRTKTMALLNSSPAINAGPSPVASFTGNQFDQRGTGFARVVGSSVDIGAFEFGATSSSSSSSSSSSTTTTAQSSTTTTGSSGLPISFNFGLGSSIRSGTLSLTLNGTGGKPGAPFQSVVHSVTTVLGDGVVDAQGLFGGTYLLPADLAPGAHDVTVATVDASGNPLLIQAWFSIDSSGTVTAISYDGPTPDTSSALPTTGSDSRMLIEFGIGAALLGSGMAAVAARRRQSLTFDPNNKS